MTFVVCVVFLLNVAYVYTAFFPPPIRLNVTYHPIHRLTQPTALTAPTAAAATAAKETLYMGVLSVASGVISRSRMFLEGLPLWPLKRRFRDGVFKPRLLGEPLYGEELLLRLC